jgi:hypothetical protein
VAGEFPEVDFRRGHEVMSTFRTSTSQIRESDLPGPRSC